MLFKYRTILLFYLASAVLILVIYALKALIVHRLPKLWACAWFFLVLAYAVPLTWAFSPDWGNQHVYRIAIWLGAPIMTLAVPAFTFVIDMRRRSEGKPLGWQWRYPIELLLGVPVWAFSWALLEFFYFGWVWI
jgi:hypothetical protein